MNYIVLDLEWNQSPCGKAGEHKSFPFEIIEIGAVKLNDKLEYVDQYQGIVRPQVYKEMNFETQKIVHVDLAEYSRVGRIFSVVAREFLKWCGEDYMFCTWGTLDLMELQRNMKYYGISYLLPGPLKYYDIQKLYSFGYEDRKIRRTLEYGVQYFGIEENEPYHSALADASYTAKVMQKMDMKRLWIYYSIDVYENPKTREEEIFAKYDNYTKYISKEFSSKEEAMRDKEVSGCKCCICGKNTRRKIRWFSSGTNAYLSLSSCFRHGFVRGKLKFKKTEDEKWYVIKIIKKIDKDAAVKVKERQEEIRKKRKQKRHEKSPS